MQQKDDKKNENLASEKTTKVTSTNEKYNYGYRFSPQDTTSGAAQNTTTNIYPAHMNDKDLLTNNTTGLRFVSFGQAPSDDIAKPTSHSGNFINNINLAAQNNHSHTKSAAETSDIGTQNTDKAPVSPTHHEASTEAGRDYSYTANAALNNTGTLKINTVEMPDSIVRRVEPNDIDQFMNASGAPHYMNDGDNEVKRKQKAIKALSQAFMYFKFGGAQEEYWELHLSDYEAIALDYQLRSKDLAYYLRLTLRDQALAVHRSEYPRNVKTYQKLCAVMKNRFETDTKRETNAKVLSRLKFGTFVKEARGSTLKSFSALVVRIEKLGAISTADKKTEKGKIAALLTTIEQTPWFITATSGVERMTHFTSAVQKINHELSKMALNDLRFADIEEQHKGGRFRIKRDILLAQDGDSEFENAGSDIETNPSPGENMTPKEDENIMFRGQRRYGKPPGRFRSNNSNNRFSGHDSYQHRYKHGEHSRDGHGQKSRLNSGSPSV